MGSDLIVAILVGPERFSPTKVKRAKQFAWEVVREAKRVWKKMQNTDYEMSKEEIEKSPLRFMLQHEQYDSLDSASICIENLAALKPAKFVDEFIEWWQTGSGRDTSGRSLPFKKGWQIVVCGETSGGQMPDGEGWGTVRTAEWFNLLNILGIK